MKLDIQIAAMEQRVLNAATLGAAEAFHRKLDELRRRRAVVLRRQAARKPPR